jgi:hypothetical protein
MDWRLTEEEAKLATLAGMDAVILLPTLNEERGLPLTYDDLHLADIRAAGWSVTPLVVDGGSTDQTREVATSLGVPVLRQRSRGKGAAMREGLEILRRFGVRFAIVLDADATYPGSAILPALELLDSGSDLVVGVRQSDRGKPRSVRDLVHRVGNVLLNFAAGQYSRSTYLDLTSGFWAIDVAKSHDLHLMSDNFGIEAELFLKAHCNGWNISQMPIVYRKRAGDSKLHAVPDGMRILLTIIRFGRQSLQASPVPISEAPTIFRDLLLTAFIDGHQDVVLLCPRDLHSEALLLAERVRRSGLSARIVVQVGPTKPLAEALPSPSSPIVGPVPAPIAGAEGVSLRFGGRGRLFHIELTDGAGSASPSEPSASYPDVAKSGAYAVTIPRGQADFLDPLRLMGHRLNGDPIAQRRRLLAANGIKVIDAPENGPEPTSEGHIAPLAHSS